MKIVLQNVQESQKNTLFRLLQYSLFEESLTDLNEMNDDALFEYPWFDAYFVETEREAYFIRDLQNGKLLGFAMINTYTSSGMQGHSIAEFMVLPKYRRQGIGMLAAHACFDLHAGHWEVRPAYQSESAYRFWEAAIGQYTAGDFSWNKTWFSFKNERKAMRSVKGDIS